MNKCSAWVIVMSILVAFGCNRPLKGKNGVVYTNAIQYNDYITHKQADIINLFLRYGEASKTSDWEKREKILDTAAATSIRYAKDVEGMPAWKGDSVFRDDAARLFMFYNKTFDGDYRNFLDMERDGTITSEEETAYNEMMTTLSNTEGRLDASLKRAQQDFAQKNGFRTERTPIQDKINEARGAK